MKLWKSVVGKLWMTILVLVSFVLTILTMMLLQFFEQYHVNEAENDLEQVANKIAFILEEHENQELARSIAWEVINPQTKVLIVEDEEHYWYSTKEEKLLDIPLETIKEDNELSKVLTDKQVVKKKASNEILMGSEETKEDEVLIVGVPFDSKTGNVGAVYLYQSLNVIQKTTEKTTQLIFLAAFIAFVLTTFFAFFLSSRITLPLIKMREAAFQMAKGKFETRLPIMTRDEIGELAIAFNKMGKQLGLNLDALRQEKEQLFSILSSMADGVITLNRSGVVQVSNPPAERFLQAWYYEQGMTENEQDIPPEIKELFNKVVSFESEQSIEISFQGRTWAIVMSPLYNGSHIRGAVAVLRDMTEERRLDKLRIDFIANVSHELRTPISMLQGYSEAIIDDIAESEQEKKEIAGVIYEESLRMGRLVNELLDIARIEAGHIQLQEESVRIQDFVDRVVRKFQGLAKEKMITLKSSCTDCSGTFTFDIDRMEQVFTNLIDNAIRHTEPDGEVEVIIQPLENGLKVDIQDSGCGIPNEDLPFVFERFYKADKARTRGKSGTGLGLAIVKNIIEAHQGTISVHSKINEGTTFSFFLPRK